jgi:hypothetical protein
MGNFLVELLKGYGPWALIVGISLLAVYKLLSIWLDEDKADKYRAMVFRAAFRLTGRRDQEKKYISNDIIEFRKSNVRKTPIYGA